MSVTIKDIARIAGVSHSTVSRALRNHPAISSDTTQRIQKIASEMGYLPSATARGLKTNRSQALGVILSSIDDPFFSEVLQGIDDICQPAGYRLFVAASQRDPVREESIVRAMGERRVDGIIVCSTPFSRAHGQQLRAYGLPIVVINNQAFDEYPYSIHHDDRTGSRLVTRHLIDLGHHQIAYLGNVQAGRTTQDRLNGFLDEMRSARLPVTQELIYQGPNGQPQGGYEGAGYFIQLPDLPSAVVCFNDQMAIGVIRAFHEAGIVVPRDCSIAGFDNIQVSAYVTPPLTTFDQPKYDLGCAAARLILRLLSEPTLKPPEPRSEVHFLKGHLLVRESTSPPDRPAPSGSRSIT
jgi:DNA-binding LacI/PurR family transcriptional regulator